MNKRLIRLLEEEALADMQRYLANCDDEAAHLRADERIVKLLRDLGMTNLAAAYEQGTEQWWYA